MNTRPIRAELLRLRKHRGLLWWSVLLTIGAVTTMFLIVLGYHLDNPARYGPAGGTLGLGRALWVLSVFGTVAAAILGASAGTSDTASGVFRDLVVTGRSRTQLFAARAVGVVAFWTPMLLAAFLISVAFTYGLAGGLATPALGQVVRDGIWVLAVTTVGLLGAVGVSVVIGSRGIAIGVLLGWQIAVSQILESISQLGVTREALFTSASQRLDPFPGDGTVVSMSVAAAVVTMTAWTILPLLAGAWRTRTRDA
jgi:ABC-type transport system involved in multi-copper enzyme maturation permease subunit